MLSILFGCVAILLGAWGMWWWRADLAAFFRGWVPISLFFAGIIAIIAGTAPKAPPSIPKKRNDD